MSALNPLILRSLSLGLKFALTIVIARTLGFDAVGVYGLAVAVSVVATKLLGLGFSAEVNRLLSGPRPKLAIRVAGTLCALYAALYLALCAGVSLAALLGILPDNAGVPAAILWGVTLVAISEHAAFEANGYVFSLHRAAAGSLLLFVRTGAWAAVAIAGLLLGAIQSIETVFWPWFAANLGVVLAAWCCIGRASRTHRAAHTQASVCNERAGAHAGMLAVWRNGLPFYAATTLLSGLQYLERFVAANALDSATLGRYVFAWSVANAVQTIAYATVAVVAGPRLVRAYDAPPGAFGALLRRALLATAGLTLTTSISILAANPLLFELAHERAGPAEIAGLAILLVSFVLRSLADVLWTAAVALRVGARVATAIACIAALCPPTALGLIAWLGATGAALAHLAASAAVTSALAYLVARALKDLVAATQEAAHAG